MQHQIEGKYYQSANYLLTIATHSGDDGDDEYHPAVLRHLRDSALSSGSPQSIRLTQGPTGEGMG